MAKYAAVIAKGEKPIGDTLKALFGPDGKCKSEFHGFNALVRKGSADDLAQINVRRAILLEVGVVRLREFPDRYFAGDEWEGIVDYHYHFRVS